MNAADLSKYYTDNRESYNKLGLNLVENLRLLLDEHGIKYSVIKYRIKEEDSFLEKFERKEYQNVHEMEDFCGVRIICYYQEDIKRIEKVLNTQLEILDRIDKDKDSFEEGKFWYRGKHYVATIKKGWGATPIFNGLEHLKMEIQIRTILMDAWAEIEHTLSYKSKFDIPIEIQREFSTVSCFLEDIDGKFQKLQTNVAHYIETTTKKIASGNFKGISLNKNSLEILLTKKGLISQEESSKGIKRISQLLEVLEKDMVTLDQLSKIIDNNADILHQFGIEYGRRYLGVPADGEILPPPMIWTIMQLIRLLYEHRVIFKITSAEENKEFIQYWKEKLVIS